jgi:hypothetical protein
MIRRLGGFLLASGLVGLLAACPPIETKIPSSTVIDVPGQGILGNNPLLPDVAFPADLIGEALAQSIERSFDTSGYDKGAVKSLKLTRLRLTVLEPQEGGQTVRDLSFLEKLTIFLGAPGTPIRVAESGDGDFDARPIVYDVPLTDAELAEAFKSADAMEMTADVVPGRTPRFQTDVQIDSEITVQIGL